MQPDRSQTKLIQPKGWMLVCDRNGVFVRHRSANADEIFPALKREEVVDLADAIGAEAAHALRNAMARIGARPRSVLALRLRAGEALLDAAVHRTPDGFIIEFEPAGLDGPASPVDMARLMLGRLSGLDAREKPEKFLATTARLLSAGLHFDRVTIASLDDGQDTLRADYGLGLEPPPAGAIAASALRRLMSDFPSMRQSRTIHDVNAAATAPLRTGGWGDAPPDLSRALLRGVSAAERACLRDLGASACLLIPIMLDGALWGLVACLNRAPALPSMESRAIAELVVDFLSLHLQIALRPPPRQPRPLGGLLAQAAIAAASAKDGCRRARNRAKNHEHGRSILRD
jgi:light-regulated signal transduction histidine kinase (bacteriophytochrome)